MAIPSGVFTVAVLIFAILYSKNVLSASTGQIQTIATITAILVGFIVIFDICGKLNKWKGILFAWLIFVAAGCMIILPGLFSIEALDWKMWLLIIICAFAFLLIHGIIFRVIPGKKKK